ncbi:hypothetical protein [Streptomyces sp. NPDC059168]|uniref:hypothetical protein n=1 Tax=Streptomyces sp. NPDC059168 TaxID=3346753 RepID=UPI0036C3CE96
MSTDLSKLTTAAERWDGMAKKFSDREGDYRRDVHGITLGPAWVGQSADAANKRFDITLKEFQSAQTEAKAIADLFRDAHTNLTELVGRLKAARTEAVEAKMKVSDQGVVTYDYTQVPEGERNALHHDPDYQASVHKAVISWQNRIDGAVKAISDADEGIEIAFKAVVQDTDIFDGTAGTGFNGHAQGDIEKYEAEKAADIATRLNNGDKVSAADLAELRRSFRDNSDDKAFSQTLLKDLGPDGTIKLINSLNDRAYDSDTKHKAQYMELQGGLADTLATATDVPASVKNMPPGSKAFDQWLATDDGRFYKQWTDGLDKYGTKNYGSKTNPLYGYQSLASMMEHSDKKYDDQFLYQVTDDMISAEKKHPGIFTEWGPGHDGIRADAIDTTLGVMSRNPSAATEFFDPAGNGSGSDHVGNNHLHYLAGSGDDTRDWPKHVIAGVSVTEMDDPLSRTGLADALQAGATGHVPYTDKQEPLPSYTHTPEQTRVMDGILKSLDQGTSTEVHKNLQVPIAQAIAEYTPDTHEILGGLDGDYATHMKDGYFMDSKHTDRAHLSTPIDSLLHVMRGVSEDPDAYATMDKAESRYINAELDKLPQGVSGYSESNPLAKSGAALGAYDAIREDVLNDERTGAYSEADWKSKIAYHIIGGAVTPMVIPTAGGSIAVGDGLQRGVDTVAWVWGNDMKADADATANEGINDRYLDTNTRMQIMVDGWGRERYDMDTQEGKDHVQGLTKEMRQGHTTGVTDARAYLTDTTN